FFFSSRRRHTRSKRDWSSDVCSSDLWKERQEDPNAKQSIPSVTEAQQHKFSDEKLNKLHEKIIIGNPTIVKEKLTALQAQYEADEWMIVTITHDAGAKRKSYTLLAEEFSS